MFPTKGAIGGSFLEVKMIFCSPRCEVRCFEDYDTPEKLWALYDELVKNGLVQMRQGRVIDAAISVA